jgi:Helix-turn-helix
MIEDVTEVKLEHFTEQDYGGDADPIAPELGPGPDELVAAGDIDEPVPHGQFLELTTLMHELKARREALGLSLTDVSARSALTRAAVSRLENGWNTNPTLDTLYRYALALDAHVTFGFEAIAGEDHGEGNPA